MRAKKRISILLTVCLLMTMLPIFSFGAEASSQEGTLSATESTDITGHWANKAITRWVDFGVIKGDSQGFRPDAPITRAELAVMLERLMGYQKKAENRFSDVNSGDWFADPVLKAQAAGILTGDGKGHAMPSSNVTREQAAVMLFRAFGTEAASVGNPSFVDAGSISSWAKTAVFGLEASKFIGGMADGSFQPKADITRAQFVTMIDNAISAYYSKPGTYTDAVSSFGVHSITVINSDGVKLKGLTIKGDLILAEGIGEGSVTLDAVRVDGRLIARGGGKNSVHIINGSQVNGKVIVERIDGAIRIVSDGVTIATLDATTEVILEGSFIDVTVSDGAKVEVRGEVKTLSVDAKAEVSVTEKGVVNTLAIDKNAGGAVLSVSGTVGTISAAAPDMKVKVGDTAKIKKIDLAKSAEGSELSLGKKAEVATLNSDAAVILSGSGAPGSITGIGKIQTKESSTDGGGGGGGGGGPVEQPDTVKPSLTTGPAVQLDETQAQVTFTSSEAGTYYYKLVDHNSSEPAISTSANGIAFTALTTPITVLLDAVPKDIYIKVKDAAGNVSDSLHMVVPGRPLAPTGLQGIAPSRYMLDDGRITGVDATMEYKQSSEAEEEYQAVEGSSIEGLMWGEYDVRYSKKINYFASSAASVTVPKPQTEPEPEVVSIVGIMMGYATGDDFDNARIRVFTEFGLYTLFLDRGYSYNNSVPKGQLVICDINMHDEVEFIAPAQEEWTWKTSRISKENGNWELSSGDKKYGITKDAVVFIYDGGLPETAECEYDLSTMEYLRYDRDITSPVSYVVTVEGDAVFALLIPKSEVAVFAPQNLKGIAPTSADGTDGQITGVNNTMEFRAEEDEAYQEVDSERNVIEGLTSGTYYVRYAETGGAPAGPDTEVVVPEFIPIDRYGLVTAVLPASDFDNLRFRMLTADGELAGLTLEDDEVLDPKAGQLLAYGISKDGQNWSIDDSDETVVSFASKDITISGRGMTLSDGNTTYDISDDVAVFTYTGLDPGAGGNGRYSVGRINLVNNTVNSNDATADFPFMIYFNEKKKVAAILVPKDRVNQNQPGSDGSASGGGGSVIVESPDAGDGEDSGRE